MKIQITIEKNGKVKIEVFNTLGQKCLKTKQLEERLGITENKTFKPEFYIEENTNTQEIKL